MGNYLTRQDLFGIVVGSYATDLLIPPNTPTLDIIKMFLITTMCAYKIYDYYNYLYTDSTLSKWFDRNFSIWFD
jgi:hypothetical protein